MYRNELSNRSKKRLQRLHLHNVIAPNVLFGPSLLFYSDQIKGRISDADTRICLRPLANANPTLIQRFVSAELGRLLGMLLIHVCQSTASYLLMLDSIMLNDCDIFRALHPYETKREHFARSCDV